MSIQSTTPARLLLQEAGDALTEFDNNADKVALRDKAVALANKLEQIQEALSQLEYRDVYLSIRYMETLSR